MSLGMAATALVSSRPKLPEDLHFELGVGMSQARRQRWHGWWTDVT